MIRRTAIVCLATASLGLSLGPVLAVTPGLSVYVFPTEGLKAASNAALPNSVAEDFGINIGGMGSDLYRVPGTVNDYWAVTDRGPNNDTTLADGSAATGFPVADFSPLIVRFKLNGTTPQIISRMAIQSSKGVGTTGLPNVPIYDGPPSTVAGGPGKYNVNGLDTEGIVRTKSGDFWLVDEYAPSVIQVGADGVIKRRLVPKGWTGVGTSYPTVDSLPAIFLKRKVNRGFEALALTPNEKYLYVGLQSPLLNPTRAVGDASYQTRILKLDAETGAVIGEWVYKFDPVNSIDSTTTRATELKLSAMVALDDDTLLVQERTDNAFIVAQVKLGAGQSILGSAYDSAATTPSLEALAVTDATLNSWVPSKTVIFRSTAVPEMPKKIEGMAVENATTLAFMNDNDFSFSYDAKANKVTAGSNPSQFLYVTLPKPLSVTPDSTMKALQAAAKAAVTSKPKVK
ncbi:MAG: esterase-like activity of phytase family protein [Actinomycetota bacterium]|nr:esterase-like activity of phytase family protein [Actinomycetota bacterium]